MKPFVFDYVHTHMKRLKALQSENETLDTAQFEVNQLIDLFVDLNFEDIHNETLLLQFKIVAMKIGYPIEMIDRVIKLGKSEYTKMMFEINENKPLVENLV